jgi:hypothetical protein
VLLMPRRNENALQFVEKGMVALGTRSARDWLTSRGQRLFVKRRDELRRPGRITELLFLCQSRDLVAM